MCVPTTTTPKPEIDGMRAAEIAPKDVARWRGCTLKYVYDLLAAGRIPGAKKVGKRWSIPASAADHVSTNGRVAKAGRTYRNAEEKC